MTATLRRYVHPADAPSCILDIWAEASPLSRWAGRPLLKDLRFRLRFLEAEVVVMGNHSQLERLTEMVDAYVRGKLTSIAKPQPNIDGLELSSVGALRHRLQFGSLSAEPGQKASPLEPIILSTLQLFDLVACLEQCTAEVTALPEIHSLTTRTGHLSGPWFKVQALRSVALVVVTVGATLTTVRLLQDNRPSAQEASAPAAARPESKRQALRPSSPAVTPRPLPTVVPGPTPPTQTPFDPFTVETPDLSELPLPAVTNVPPPPPALPPPPPVPPASSAPAAPPSAQQPEVALAPSDPVARSAPGSAGTNQDRAVASSPGRRNRLLIDSAARLQQQLQGSWLPPPNLAAPLDYRVAVSPNGAVQEVAPLSESAQTYRNLLPLTPLPSNFGAGSPEVLYLRLNPDGRVQVSRTPLPASGNSGGNSGTSAG